MTAPVERKLPSIIILDKPEGLLKFSPETEVKNLIKSPFFEIGPKEVFGASPCPRIVFDLSSFSCRDVRYLNCRDSRMIKSELTHYEVVACIVHSIFEALDGKVRNLHPFSFQGRCRLGEPSPCYTIGKEGVLFKECPDRRGLITHSYVYFGSNKLCLFLNAGVDYLDIMMIIRRVIL